MAVVTAAEPLTSEEAAMVAANTGLLRFCARRVQTWHPSQDLDDLVGRGVFGLINAVRGFDPSLGYRFSTYAVRPIISMMLREIKSQRTQGRGLGEVPLSLDASYGEYDALVEYLPSCEDPEGQIVGEAFMDWVTSRLPKTLRAAMPVLMGLRTSVEVAEELGVSCRRVNQMCFQARELLRELLRQMLTESTPPCRPGEARR